ncbi:MAG: hypothetical protein ABI548_20380 [Polyangiaceae bacterium]
MSAANPLSQINNDESEAPVPASEPSRPTEPRRHPAPVCNALDSDLGIAEEAFDFHDTIPAPPWLDDGPDTVEMPLEPLVPSR